jgi:uncharacterized membrane protein
MPFLFYLREFLVTEGSSEVQDIITSATVPLALPLLLFGTRIKTWVKMAGKTFLSMLLAIVALSIIVGVTFYAFGDKIDNSWKIGGLLVGLYTGGTPNLASLQAGLEVSPEVYLMVNTYDIVLSSIFLLLIMSTGGKFLRGLLPKYKKQKSDFKYDITYTKEEPDPYDSFFKKKYFPDFLLAFGAAVLIAGLSVGLSFIITKGISMLVVILSITSLSLVGSLIPKLNKAEKSFEGGMYLILVFSIAVASMVKLEDFINISPSLFWFVTMVISGTFILHILFSAIFKVDYSDCHDLLSSFCTGCSWRIEK